MKHRPPHRSGFSLILSLTVMAGIVMLLVTLSAFITIESRAAMNQQLATRARLNALVSMRLALAHLQQEAGADRRSTARADITQPGVSAGSLRNPMWTGVWRTDKPDLPPAWLVSGRGDQPAGTQSISLFQTGNSPDYPAGYWAPWQSLGSAISPAELVPLVGTGSALPHEGDTPSGLVSLPKITLPDEDIAGNSAYWVGDEGIKARPNLLDTRSKDPQQAGQLISLRSPVTHGLLKDLPNQEQLEQISRLSEIHLTGLGNPTGSATFDIRRHHHDLSVTSAGVMADSLHGGLKRDLSLAFELDDARFAQTEFGGGATGSAATHTDKGFEATLMPVLNENGGRALQAAPVFSRAKSGGGMVRGPTWWALRDYHRLYKQLGWTAAGTTPRSTGIPSLIARPLWPNVAAAHPSGPPASSGLPNNGIRNRIYGYPDVYDGDLPSTIDPNASDLLNGDSGRIITRPLNVAATPYVQRVSLAFSVNKMQWFVWKSVRVGKTLVWYQEEWVDIRLNITPIVVVHNPYNVRMTWTPANSGATGSGAPYAAAISFSDLSGWLFRFKQYRPGTLSDPHVYETPLSRFFNLQDNNSDDEDTFRLYLTKDNNPTITLEPGEFRVFSCKPVFGEWTKSIVLDNTYDPRGGFRDNVWDWGFGDAATETFDLASPIAFEIVPGDRLRMRHAVTAWPGDQLKLATNPGNSDKTDFFYRNSEVSEVSLTGITPSKYPSSGEKFFSSWRHVRDKFPRPDPYYDGRNPYPTPTSPPLEPDLISVIDISVKPADAADAPFPTFTHSNPLAAAQKASAAGRIGSGTGAGFRGASPSYQLTLRNGSWLNVLANTDGGRLAFGGNSAAGHGSPKVIFTEVPLVQPTSLAQYTHANFGIRDQQPLLSIGNSFASPFVDARKVMQSNGPGWTEFDQSYLLNAALWDGYFLSSLAPWMKTGDTGEVTAPAPTTAGVGASAAASDPNENKSLSTVIEEFVAGERPLDNPRFTAEQSSRAPDETAAALADYRRSASVLLNKGAFNVNSTSVFAWQTFLGSAKKFALAGLGATSPDAVSNARFPRTLSKESAVAAASNFHDPSNWAGFANLTDEQIEKLAKAIVAENKARFALQVRTERDLATPPGSRLFGGLTRPATPYLALSEFINRFLCPETWASRCGALQAAILRADQDSGARLSDRLVTDADDRRLTEASLTTSTAGDFPSPENIEAGPQGSPGRVHTAMGAPGNLLQSDLLQSLGSALASRSDTFTLRCYGDASQPDGQTGYSWLEAVVQRVPDFIDATNAPETGNSAPRPLSPAAGANADPTLSSSLTLVNQVLGRRFKIISVRWLKHDEI